MSPAKMLNFSDFFSLFLSPLPFLSLSLSLSLSLLHTHFLSLSGHASFLATYVVPEAMGHSILITKRLNLSHHCLKVTMGDGNDLQDP